MSLWWTFYLAWDCFVNLGILAYYTRAYLTLFLAQEDDDDDDDFGGSVPINNPQRNTANLPSGLGSTAIQGLMQHANLFTGATNVPATINQFSQNNQQVPPASQPSQSSAPKASLKLDSIIGTFANRRKNVYALRWIINLISFGVYEYCNCACDTRIVTPIIWYTIKNPISRAISSSSSMSRPLFRQITSTYPSRLQFTRLASKTGDIKLIINW
jgi:hypothetical protein